MMIKIMTGNWMRALLVAVLLQVGLVQATTQTLTVNPSTVQVGDAITITATLTGINPTGTVCFKRNNTMTLACGVTIVNGVATVTIPSSAGQNPYATLTAGNYTVSSYYAGDSNDGSVFTETALTVIPSTNSQTLLSLGPNPAIVGQNVTMTTQVIGNTPTGTVTFKDGTNVLGSGNVNGSGYVSYTASFSNTGAHSITATYNGDSNNPSSTSSVSSLTVNPPPATQVLTISPSTVYIGNAITLTATLTGNNPTGTVCFKRNGWMTLVCGVNVVNGVATTTIPSSPGGDPYATSAAGTYTITAAYSGDSNNGVVYTDKTLTVLPTPTTTTNLSANPNPVIIGSSVTLTANVIGNSPTGTVTFKDGTTTLGTITVASASASYSANLTTLGTHSLTAVYSGDTDDAASTSTALSVTVNPVPATQTLTVTPNTVLVGEAITITATLSGNNPTGAVCFKRLTATTNLGLTCPSIVNGVATITIPSPDYATATAGSYVISSYYGGDANNGPVYTETPLTVNEAVSTYFIFSDHLNTPRLITDKNNVTVWRWDNNDPFGNNAVNEDPDQNGQTFSCNLRFPGQYYDQETNLNYNYFRDYNPATGRYIESDPIGLQGSINTYAYVENQPLNFVDPTGEAAALALEIPIVITAIIISSQNNRDSIINALTNTVSTIRKICKPDDEDPCEKIRKEIKDLQSQLKTKEDQLARDPYDLYNRAYSTNPGGDLAGKGTYVGHVSRIDSIKLGMARKIAQAKAMGCL